MNILIEKRGNMKENFVFIQKISRTIAILYLVITVLAPFSMLYVPGKLVVPGNESSIVTNILSLKSLFQAGMACDALIFLLEIVITALLYTLLKPVNNTFSLMAAFARLAMTIIQGINMANYLFILLLIGGTGTTLTFSGELINGMVMFFMNAHTQVAVIWGLFFGLHLAILGYLVYRSKYIPKFVGGVLLATSASYLIQGFATLLFPEYNAIIKQISIVSMIEIIFPVWLLIKGINKVEWEKYLPATR
jgi:hypothetical protein